MTRYLISFDHGAMDSPSRGGGARRPRRVARSHPGGQGRRGVGVRRGCLSRGRGEHERGGSRWDGHRRHENRTYIAGVTIIDVPSREDALKWAAKLATANRCAQEVREFAPVPTAGS